MWRKGRLEGEVALAFGRSDAGPDPVVALHGITAQHRSFNAVARHLSHADGMVALDLRGRGDSDKPTTGYGLDAHAGDVIRVLDHLGIASALLAGHSMGAFVALHVARCYPGRVRALGLLDGGWPRRAVSLPPGVEEGLARAFRRLDMTFATVEDYLDFWFPGQGLRPDDLPGDLADYYRYDLAPVAGGLRPKASLAAATEDAASLTSAGPTAHDLAQVSCPVALVRPTEGFFPGTRPLIDDLAHRAMVDALQVVDDVVVAGANHYTMLWDPHAPAVAGALDGLASA